MTILQLTQIFEVIAVGLLTSFVFFWLIPRYRLDVFRQRLFVIRDEMFDFAAAGNISFSDPAYLLLRQQLNGLIRYGHQITFYRLVMSALMRSQSDAAPIFRWNEAWDAAISNVQNQSVRVAIVRFHEQAMTSTMKRLVGGSPILSVLLALSVLVILLQGGYTGARQLVRLAGRKILSGPIDLKRLEEDAVCATA